MSNQIEDRFAGVSCRRQRYRLRRKAERRCVTCGEVRSVRSSTYCSVHLEAHADRMAAWRAERRAKEAKEREASEPTDGLDSVQKAGGK